jgi:hypothetical protein
MSLSPRPLQHYHVFIASPGDVAEERRQVRRFFDSYNRSTAHLLGVQFDVIDWENYATIGVGRPQDLITRQTLERFRSSLALVIGIMGQRFGSPTGTADSGTEEEFNWAIQQHLATGFPEIKWFFRHTPSLVMPADVDQAQEAVEQWRRVQAFQQRLRSGSPAVFYAEYSDVAAFSEVFGHDLALWLADRRRPWFSEVASRAIDEAARDFDPEPYRKALLEQVNTLNFDMLDTSAAAYNAVRLWSIFVPQSVRACQSYYPQVLEMPKEHLQRLRQAGELDEDDPESAQADTVDPQRLEYLNQPAAAVADRAWEIRPLARV